MLPVNIQSSKALFDAISKELAAIYPAEESKGMTFWLLESRLGLSKVQILSDKPLTVEQQKELATLQDDVQRLAQHEPIQYVLGETWFGGLRFKVSPSVLIPRPETEELISMIIEDYRGSRGLRVLDIGTGSGCIALGLAAGLDQAEVWAMDISEAALEMAKGNAVLNGLQVYFILADVLKLEPKDLGGKFSIIVSNPPYVKMAEKELMRENVLAHEPHLALFVDDNKPLLFYDAIAELALHKLLPGGSLYFEINEAYGEATAAMLEAKGFTEVKVAKDMFGKDRMVKCKLPDNA
jgi:release factor glutamine methyltransferase